MAKTRSQTGNSTIKQEEEDSKSTLLFNGVTNTKSSRITKRIPPIINNRPVSAQQIKVEGDTDNKSLLKSQPEPSNSAPKGQRISQEQINQLIHYIVNDNMSIRKASRKVNISAASGCIYYKFYKDDPEKRIPLPQDQTPTMHTQEQVGNLIRYIDDDKMTVKEASVKANMPYHSAYQYYNRYWRDPNHNVPIPKLKQCYTRYQKDEFINYVINDKLSITAASKKAKISFTVAQDYYHKYFKVQNPDIARPSHIITPKCYTQEQIKELISYIVDGKMNIMDASRKANFNQVSASVYYRQYLNDQNMEVPAKRVVARYTQDQKNAFIRYVVDDKMAIKAASKKANICGETGRKYYRQYLKDHNIDVPILKRYTQEQKRELIGYIHDNKMTIKAAAKKANMSKVAGYRYYRKYILNHQHAVPPKYITQDQISELVGYIVVDKMSIAAASKKANMAYSSSYKYYRQYLKNQKRDADTLCL